VSRKENDVKKHKYDCVCVDCENARNAAHRNTCGATGSALAHEIATALLTVQELDGPLECDRAQMMCNYGNGNETEHGGRNKQSIVTEIDAVLARHGIGVPNMALYGHYAGNNKSFPDFVQRRKNGYR